MACRFAGEAFVGEAVESTQLLPKLCLTSSLMYGSLSFGARPPVRSYGHSQEYRMVYLQGGRTNALPPSRAFIVLVTIGVAVVGVLGGGAVGWLQRPGPTAAGQTP